MSYQRKKRFFNLQWERYLIQSIYFSKYVTFSNPFNCKLRCNYLALFLDQCSHVILKDLERKAILGIFPTWTFMLECSLKACHIMLLGRNCQVILFFSTMIEVKVCMVLRIKILAKKYCGPLQWILWLQFRHIYSVHTSYIVEKKIVHLIKACFSSLNKHFYCRFKSKKLSCKN